MKPIPRNVQWTLDKFYVILFRERGRESATMASSSSGRFERSERAERSPPIGLSVVEADRVAAIMAGLDAMAATQEARWGVGRLPLLVNVDLRERFFRQARKLDEALAKLEPQVAEIEIEAGKMGRAWAALDRAAIDAGAKPLSPDVWEIPLADGSVAALVRTSAEAGKLAREGRAMTVWTVEELANVIDSQQLINRAKAVFKGAAVVQIRHKRPKFVEDDLPEWGA